MFIDEEDKVVEQTPQEQQRQIVTQKTTTKKNDSEVAVNNYQIEPFTAEAEAAALKAAGESSAFQSLMNKRNERMQAFGTRAKKAEDATKALAWTNLFTNLAKIAGMGHAPVVREDTGFLSQAFSQADALRRNYYAREDAYEDMLDKYKMSYVDAARNAHQKQEIEKFKAAGKEAEAKNKLALQNTTTTTTTTTTDPFKEADANRKDEEQKQKKIEQGWKKEMHDKKLKLVEAQTKAANNKADKSESGDEKLLFTYPHTDGNSYQITKSDGRLIKQKLLEINERSSKDEVFKGNKKLKEQLEDDIALIDQAMEYGGQDSALADLVAKYINVFPEEFKDVLLRSKRTKTHSNENIEFLPESGNEETETDIDNLVK